MPGVTPVVPLSAERMLRALGHAVIVTDPAGTVRYWNQAAEALYGWSAQEAIGRNIGSLTVPDVTQKLAEEIMDSLRAGGQWSGGFSVRRKDGVTFPALVTDTVVRADDGSIEGIIGVSIDLGQALRPLLTHSSDAALILTADAEISYVTPTATRLFGWEGADLFGTSLWSLLHEDDRPAALAQHRRVIATRAPTPALECRLRASDGTWCWVDLLLTNLLDDPAVRGLVCNLRDISERRAARDDLVALTEQLQVALTSRVVIEQAKGLIAGRSGTDLGTAFARLRRYARDHNRKLREVAQLVVDGDLDLPG